MQKKKIASAQCLEQDWQNTGNEESRVRRDEVHRELATLTGGIAPAVALPTGPT